MRNFDGSNWKIMSPQVQFAYNATRALKIEHAPFKAIFCFSHEEPPNMLFNMRPSIHSFSQDATERLTKWLQELHALARSVLQMHKAETQARSEPYKASHFVRGDNHYNESLLARTTELVAT
jgi:hypothetical protein